MRDWTNDQFKTEVANLTQKTEPADKDRALVYALRAIAIALVYLAEQVRFIK